MSKNSTPAWVKPLLAKDGYRLQIKSVMDFMRIFRDDEKCLEYLGNLKWAKKGWHCLKCGNDKYTFLNTRKLIKCIKCGYQESFIVNTVMEGTHKPLSNWFWAIYTVATQKTGLSAMELYRQLDFGNYKHAWTWLHKIRMAMVEADRTPLKDDVEVDETYVFTGMSGRGRKMGGAKSLVVGAVEVLTSKKQPTLAGRIRLRAIPSASAKNLQSFIMDHVERKSIVRTDGWTGYKTLGQRGYRHVTYDLKDPHDAYKKLPRIHRVFSNLQNWLVGTHRFVSQKHLQNYLNEFAYRYNARWDPISAFNNVLLNAVITDHRTYNEFAKVKQPTYVNPEAADDQ